MPWCFLVSLLWPCPEFTLKVSEVHLNCVGSLHFYWEFPEPDESLFCIVEESTLKICRKFSSAMSDNYLFFLGSSAFKKITLYRTEVNLDCVGSSYEKCLVRYIFVGSSIWTNQKLTLNVSEVQLEYAASLPLCQWKNLIPEIGKKVRNFFSWSSQFIKVYSHKIAKFKVYNLEI